MVSVCLGVHPISQEFMQCCPGNSSNFGLFDDGPILSFLCKS